VLYMGKLVQVSWHPPPRTAPSSILYLMTLYLMTRYRMTPDDSLSDDLSLSLSLHCILQGLHCLG